MRLSAFTAAVSRDSRPFESWVSPLSRRRGCSLKFNSHYLNGLPGISHMPCDNRLCCGFTGALLDNFPLVTAMLRSPRSPWNNISNHIVWQEWGADEVEAREMPHIPVLYRQGLHKTVPGPLWAPPSPGPTAVLRTRAP